MDDENNLELSSLQEILKSNVDKSKLSRNRIGLEIREYLTMRKEKRGTASQRQFLAEVFNKGAR